MELEHLLFDVSDHIATMTLNRPEARNAFSQDMRRSMGVALERVREGAGTDVKALIITGAGGGVLRPWRRQRDGGSPQGISSGQSSGHALEPPTAEGNSGP